MCATHIIETANTTIATLSLHDALPISEVSKNSGRSEQQLAAEAILAACKDAGINPHDIDGMTTFSLDNSDEIDVMRSLGCKDIKDRKSTRLNSSHDQISYAVFCLKKKK